MHFLTSALAASILATNTFAHPGHDIAAEIAERAAFTKFSKKDLSHCAEKFRARGIEQRSIARRAATAQKARQKRGLSTDTPYLQARGDHESTIDYNSDTASDILFASNGSCILSPEVTQGPYWVEGEYVREDLTEEQEGVELILDTQVVDITTCEPVSNAMIEIWACNSTGVYSGVVASGNGVGTADPSNLNNTFLRGLQPTDDDGVAKFTTLFPGHYTGRTTHIHVMVHFNGTSFENGTYAGGYVSHVGQLFFDQDLITEVEASSVYSTNTQELTTNDVDSIFATESANGHDPIVAYSKLGEAITEGIFAWISFGVDLTSQQTLTGAATLTENGGVENENSGMGGGQGGPGGNGTFPGGNGGPPSGVPTGAAPTGTATAGNGTVASGTSSTSGGAVSTSTFVAGASSSTVVSSGVPFCA